MSQTYQIQYFLGANSPQGFYSLYDQLLPPETANAIYILKGGPGCGKSTLMRQVAAQAAQAGETAEYILCSGDPDSLDGVVLPRLKAALVDGTAPHVIEPKYPGVVEQYVNLGVCYDREGLQAVREELQGCSEEFQRAMAQAWTLLRESRDPQQADLLLDRSCYQEMERLAKALGSPFLLGYVRLSVDVANLRTAVRAARMGKEGDFLRRVLLPGGNVSQQTVASARADTLGEVFQSGPLAQAAQLGAKVALPGGGSLTAFEKACDDALTAYLAAARMVPFGEQTVIGYLYAKELEFTAVRTIFAGRAAGLDGDTIRARLRQTYV